jgi:hypothetical protein
MTFFFAGYPTTGCRESDSNSQREERSTIHAQVWLPRPWNHGLRNGQKPP